MALRMDFITIPWSQRWTFDATRAVVNSDQFGSKTVSYTAWAKGSDFLMKFTSPAEFGQKILRTNNRIYHFFPESEAVFTRSRGDSVVGLISYDDLTDDSAMLDTYNVKLEGEEILQGISCFRILMEVKPGKQAAYPVQRVRIEKATEDHGDPEGR